HLPARGGAAPGGASPLRAMEHRPRERGDVCRHGLRGARGRPPPRSLMTNRIAVSALGLCLGALGLARPAPAGEDAPPPPVAVAVVGGIPITAVQLEGAIKGPLSGVPVGVG